MLFKINLACVSICFFTNNSLSIDISPFFSSQHLDNWSLLLAAPLWCQAHLLHNNNGHQPGTHFPPILHECFDTRLWTNHHEIYISYQERSDRRATIDWNRGNAATLGRSWTNHSIDECQSVAVRNMRFVQPKLSQVNINYLFHLRWKSRNNISHSACSICCAKKPRTDYCGHYIILCGYDDRIGSILYMNPTHTNRKSTLSSSVISNHHKNSQHEYYSHLRRSLFDALSKDAWSSDRRRNRWRSHIYL